MKYQYIIADIIEKIENNQLQAKDKLPSIRQLSQTYDCTKETVQKALTELKYRRYIYPIAKSGYYVLGNPQEVIEDIDLPYEVETTPAYEDFRICLQESLVGRENHLFNYYSKQEGLDELIAAVQEQLVAGDIYCKPEQIVITAGTQQALYILSQLRTQGAQDHILLEQPTYHRMNHLITQLNLPHMTINRGLQGLDLKELETLFQTGKIRYFYTIPRLHMPLGVRYSLAEKQAIVDLANRYQVYIIEDDYLADLDNHPSPPLHYYDTHNRVIYIKSFSASISPALRIASIVLPKELLRPFLSYKQLMDYDTNLIIQQALTLYLTNGMFAQNNRRIRHHYQELFDTMRQALAEADLPYPYQLTYRGLLIQLPPNAPLAQLKYSQLPVQFLTEHYLYQQKTTYCQLAYTESFGMHLQQLKNVLK